PIPLARVWLAKQCDQIMFLKFPSLRAKPEQEVLVEECAILSETVFLHALESGIVNVDVVASAQNRPCVRSLHLEEHSIAANKYGAVFTGAVVDDDGHFVSLAVRREAMKILGRGIKLPEGGFQRQRCVVLRDGSRARSKRDAETQPQGEQCRPFLSRQMIPPPSADDS